ncbi:choice-of-anchor Q domain-containing protein [Halomonas denitrificans]|nr:hypothetical protein [Halomonas denitrificans]
MNRLFAPFRSLVSPRCPVRPLRFSRFAVGRARAQLIALALAAGLPLAAAHSATIVVNSTGTLSSPGYADDGQCTLFEAVASANDNQPSGTLPGECIAGEAGVADRIVFDPSLIPGAITVETALVVTDPVEIVGPHRDLMTLQGIANDRILDISTQSASGDFLIRGLTLDGGYAGASDPLLGIGGAIHARHSVVELRIEEVRFSNNGASYAGGALAIAYGSNGTTTIVDSVFESNTAQGIADVNDGGGGAIWIGGSQSVTIERCSFVENDALGTSSNNPGSDAGGGAIWMLSSSAAAVSTLDVFSSTFSGNTTTGVGGAIAIGGPVFPADHSVVGIRHSTLTLNVSDSDSDADFRSGGGIYSSASDDVVLYNTIIARNVDESTSPGPNLTGVFESLGHNFVSNNTGVESLFPFGIPNANNDFASQPDLDPGLEPLTYDGGPTPTHPLTDDALVLDQGRCGSQAIDQRHTHDSTAQTRAVDQPDIDDLFDGCDIGAYEEGATPAAIPRPDPDAYTVLEDGVLIVDDIDGSLTPGNSDDDGVLVNDTHDSGLSLVVYDVGTLAATSTDMSDGGVFELSFDGALVYTPPADESGTAEFFHRVTEGLWTSGSFTDITVLPVNDAPSFQAITNSIDVGVARGGSAGYAVDIDAGAPDEAGQTLSFELTLIDGDGGFFNSPPTIDPVTGRLHFDLAPGGSGHALYEVVLRDDGGTANGGVDASDAANVLLYSDRMPPTLTIQSPSDGSSFDAGVPVTFSAEAFDGSGMNISSQVEWGSDRDGALGIGASIQVDSLSSGAHRIGARVFDNDGVPVTDFVDVVIVASLTPPQVFIDSPLNGETFEAGVPVIFDGEAFDAEDGVLDGALQWSSNLQGPIGNGSTFQTDQLVVGDHVVSARAIDSDGMAGIDQVDVTIVPAPTEILFRDGFESPGAR